MDEVIDLRSDTVTRPSPGMRDAMRNAVVGDDQYAEDPTANRLQDLVAGLLGKEAALWLPTGTMANQVALRALTSPGDDVIVNGESHMFWHETGTAAANAGVQFTALGTKGVFTNDQFVAALKPRGHMVYPPTTLVVIENTHNRVGGVVFPQEEAEQICETAAQHDVARYLNRTRLWNAAAATGRDLAELAEPFDLVSVNLAKGLGAPGGALLAGSREVIDRCVRYRRARTQFKPDRGGSRKRSSARGGTFGFRPPLDRPFKRSDQYRHVYAILRRARWADCRSSSGRAWSSDPCSTERASAGHSSGCDPGTVPAGGGDPAGSHRLTGPGGSVVRTH